MPIGYNVDVDIQLLDELIATLEDLKHTLEGELYPTVQSVTALTDIEVYLAHYRDLQDEYKRSRNIGVTSRN